MNRAAEILALEPDWLLVRRTAAGTDRVGGGALVFDHLQLWGFGPDGLLQRIEHFTPEQGALGLERFEELRSPPPARPVRRNRASAAAEALVAALRSGEPGRFDTHCADDLEVVHHATGIRYDRAGALTTWRDLAANPEADVSLALHATLGDSLALAHISIRANRAADAGFDVGAVEASVESLIKTDAEGRLRLSEPWPSERLGED